MTPEQFLDERFPHLKGPYRSLALKAINGEQMPLSPIDEMPLMYAIKQAWRDYLLPRTRPLPEKTIVESNAGTPPDPRDAERRNEQT